MKKNLTFQFNDVPSPIVEPLGNLIRKSVYTLRTNYCVVGVSINVSNIYSGQSMTTIPYEVLPYTTSSILDFGIKLLGEDYEIKSEVIDDFESDGYLAGKGQTSIDGLYRLTKNLNNVTEISLQDFTEFFESESKNPLINFNQEVILSVTFYIMKVTSDLSSDDVQQILTLLNRDAVDADKVKIAALPAQLNSDLVSLDYSEKDKNKLTVTVKCSKNTELKVQEIIGRKLPDILKNYSINA